MVEPQDRLSHWRNVCLTSLKHVYVKISLYFSYVLKSFTYIYFIDQFCVPSESSSRVRTAVCKDQKCHLCRAPRDRSESLWRAALCSATPVPIITLLCGPRAPPPQNKGLLLHPQGLSDRGDGSSLHGKHMGHRVTAGTGSQHCHLPAACVAGSELYRTPTQYFPKPLTSLSPVSLTLCLGRPLLHNAP